MSWTKPSSDPHPHSQAAMTSDPELVSYEQVRELVEAEREAEPWLDYLATNHAPDWAPHEGSILGKDHARLRAVLDSFEGTEATS